MEVINKICNDLEELQTLYNSIDKLEFYLGNSKEHAKEKFINDYLIRRDCFEPQKKKLENVLDIKAPNRNKLDKAEKDFNNCKKLVIIMFVSSFILPIILLKIGVIKDMVTLFIILFFASLIYFFVRGTIVNKNREKCREAFAVEEKKYELNESKKKVNKEAEYYNKTTYVEEKNRYDKTTQKAETKYEEYILECKTEYEKLTSEFSEYKDLLPSDYYQHASSIATILRNMRADSIKEAINVLENDLYNQRLVELERERVAGENQARLREQQQRDALLQAQLKQNRMLEQQNKLVEEQTRIEKENQAREEMKARFDNERRRNYDTYASLYERAVKQYNANPTSVNKHTMDQAFANMMKYKQ